MGLFSRRGDPERERAKAIATRGVRTVARVVAMQVDGSSGGPAMPVVFRLAFTPTGGKPVEVEVLQNMNATTLTGLEPGVEAAISYDGDDPAVVVVWHAAHIRIVEGLAVAAPAPPQPKPKPESAED